MIVVSVVVALAMVLLSSRVFKVMNTPDMRYYSAMARGLFVPRPYSLRRLPMVMPDKLRAWQYLQVCCYVCVATCVHILAERVGAPPLTCVATVFSIHFIRLSVALPVLLDMPILAVACLTAVMAPMLGGAIVCIVIASVLIHERAPLWCGVYALPFAEWQFIAIGVGVATVFTAIDYKSRKHHTDEDDVPWLKSPLGEAIKAHSPRLIDWNAWVRPWGLTVLGLVVSGWWVWTAIAVGYAGCLVAQDRARIYGMAIVPLALAVASLFGDYAFVVPIVNWFTNSKEI